VMNLNNGVLPIQGPPGTGKSHTASLMIIALIKAGKKIGISALSHKVITALLEKVSKAAAEEKMNIRIVQKVTDVSTRNDTHWIEAKDYDDVLDSIDEGFNIAAGTSFMWSREDFFEKVDFLFVDEAGQLSLIDTLALSHAGKNLVLMGDPQQLKQPQKGSHPEGTEVSALEHILQEEKTISENQGVFLGTTWRMHPSINSYVSELFYDNRLHAKSETANQMLEGNTVYQKPGLYVECVQHEGNQNSSSEEVAKIVSIVNDLTTKNVSWIDCDRQKHELTSHHIKIIAPYNAQVDLLQEALPGIQIGTVDKFQGQEAPVIIFSMATSTPEDAPRGMEFLYSLNRLNVAVSRARAVFILVANPALFEPVCKSAHQMQLANALCRLREKTET
jgi:superfamily I DNA and/or RNA helicase